jgi:hypothetical protein
MVNTSILGVPHSALHQLVPDSSRPPNSALQQMVPSASVYKSTVRGYGSVTAY